MPVLSHHFTGVVLCCFDTPSRCATSLAACCTRGIRRDGRPGGYPTGPRVGTIGQKPKRLLSESDVGGWEPPILERRGIGSAAFRLVQLQFYLDFCGVFFLLFGCTLVNTHTHTHTHTHFQVQGLEKGVSENEAPGPIGAYTTTHNDTITLMPNLIHRISFTESHSQN